MHNDHTCYVLTRNNQCNAAVNHGSDKVNDTAVSLPGSDGEGQAFTMTNKKYFDYCF